MQQDGDDKSREFEIQKLKAKRARAEAEHRSAETDSTTEQIKFEEMLAELVKQKAATVAAKEEAEDRKRRLQVTTTD